MKKFAVFSGFLGAGKTTAMMALTRLFNTGGAKAWMISNDLGGKGLADYRYSAASGCAARELTGKCICYQTENLADTLRGLFDGGAELVISDIPGFGVGALEHVYHTLRRDYPDAWELAPFTVITERRRLLQLMGAGGTLPEEMDYILRAQLREADLIVLNKCDLLTEEERTECMGFLGRLLPKTPVLAVSALTGQGMEALARALTEGTAALKRPDIGYGGAAFSAAMGKLSEYYGQYYVRVCCDTFDPDAYVTALGAAAGKALGERGREIPHLKILGQREDGRFVKGDLLGADRPVQLTSPLDEPCVDLAVTVNASAVAPADELQEAVGGAVRRVSAAFDLSLMIYSESCFDVGGEGQ